MATHEASEKFKSKPIGDSLLSGVVAMLLINVVQRIVGLGRNLGFCHFLAEEELGLWSLANSFLIIAPPLIMFGLPGSFGKFVEHYRQRGGLKCYLCRVASVCGLGAIGLASVLILFPEWSAWLLYGQKASEAVLAWTIVTFAILVFHNFIYDVVLSLRLARLASWMQFVNSFSFCLIGVICVAWTQSWVCLLPSYALACLLATLPGLYGIWTARSEFEGSQLIPARGMWQRIVPFAIAVWVSNLLMSTFELSDRYMLLHFCCGGQEVGQSLVGQYYCGRIIPNLLFSLALVFSGMLLPYLSVDWEKRNLRAIGRTMRRILPSLSILFTGLAAGATAFAPWLFDWGLQGRYAVGASILGLSLIQTIWSSLSMTAAAYLMCAEKGKQATFLLALGVGVNLLLNRFWIPGLGLYGAVLATTVANATLLVLTLYRVHREGCLLDWKVAFFSLFPLLLLAGPTVTLFGLLLIIVAASRSSWILTPQDRKDIDAVIIPRIRQYFPQVTTLWPA